MFGLVIGFGIYLVKSGVAGLSPGEAMRAATGFWWAWFVFWACLDAATIVLPLIGGGVLMTWLARVLPPQARPMLGLFGTGLGAGVLSWLLSRENMLRLAGTVILLWGAHTMRELADREVAGTLIPQGAYAVEFLVMFLGLLLKRRAARRMITTFQVGGGAPFPGEIHMGSVHPGMRGTEGFGSQGEREEIEVEAEVMDSGTGKGRE